MTAPVLIFGATGGIGEATARLLAARDTPLVLSARDPARLAVLAGSLGAEALPCDVLDDASLEATVAAATRGGTLGGLVFAVGSLDLSPLRRALPDQFAAAFAVNVTAAAQAVRHAQRALSASGGSVVLFSSVAASRGFRNHAVIGSAKAAVEGLARSLAAELAPKVRVNCIAPSLTRTPLTAALTARPESADALAKMHPLGRLGEAADMAAAVAWLLAPESAFVTGQIIPVDGGRGSIVS
jgi:NAD(P)-dependent dehydrogenase (short-subunit alcohol dehydrogenase family)